MTPAAQTSTLKSYLCGIKHYQTHVKIRIQLLVIVYTWIKKDDVKYGPQKNDKVIHSPHLLQVFS